MGHYSDFKSNSLSDFFNVISAYPFAMICKNNQNTGIPDIVNVPVILSESGRRLEFHFARANPAWKNFTEEGRVRVVFNGPNAHVSPSWYSERFANGDRSRTAPTWDYVQAVTAGCLHPMNTPELEVHLNRLTAYFEGQNGWDFAELAPDAKAQWVKYIGGFTLDISNVEVTAKLSQEQSSRDRSNVATALLERGQGADTAVARLIMQGIRGF